MELPKGLLVQSSVDQPKVCTFVKSFYGLKQASRKWGSNITEALIAPHYSQSHLDYSSFTNKQGTNIVIILVYVNDLLITGNNVGYY